MEIYDESLYCQECNSEITVAQSKFCNNYCDDCYKVAFIAEQEMQVLDKAWGVYQSEDIDPRKQDEDERIESSAQRFMESQADQDYWQRRAAEGYEPWHGHSPTCNCPECCGDEPDETPGWPPNAQTQAHCDEVMRRPDEF